LTPRVAFFTDTYDEINGVALTSRQLESFARRRDYPFLTVRGGPETRFCEREILLERGKCSIGLDRGLMLDPFLWRHYRKMRDAVLAFQPDVIHVVSPGDVSELGVAVSFGAKIPLVISWHTNLHEFGEMRLRRSLMWVPRPLRDGICHASKSAMFTVETGFYRFGKLLFAPNPELIAMLRSRTGKPVRLMSRGVDTTLFHPSRRSVSDEVFRLGFVGRITPEKSVRLFAKIEEALLAQGFSNFQFVVVGDGSERGWLSRNLRHVEMPGILRGERLAEAYANMDLFLFPSRTDTFGNVIQEAMASGVPSVVTDAGGPKFIVREAVTGFITHDDDEFAGRTIELMRDRGRLSRMREACLQYVANASWDHVFEEVYAGYAASRSPS
jgi:glycosyltransferase involved in cell wall biosynthesis